MLQGIILKAVMQMAIKIGHASIDENGKISNGKTGDQTGKEIHIRSWYSKPWNVYLECTDKVLADKAAKIMEEICRNDNFGYDQVERWTGYNSIVKNKYSISPSKGEFDCSSLIITCYILAGLIMSVDGYTGNLKAKLLKTGKFISYTDKDHLNSDKYARRGGIYLKEGSHVVMALEDGSAYANPFVMPIKTVTKDSSKNDIGWLQFQLNKALKSLSSNTVLKVDKSYGKLTKGAVCEFWEFLGWNKDGKDDGTKAGVKTINALSKY